ncbi:MAG: type IV pilus twitching motility protein PilT [Eubacterium sp.]|nr:type IV pilus twitching motility protein PilT [Eubacterium sp.]
MKKLTEYLNAAKTMGASDVHFAPGAKPMFRIDGQLEPYGDKVLMPADIDPFAYALLRDEQIGQLEHTGELDSAFTIPGFGRMRVNVFKQRGTYALAIRILSFVIPTADELGIPEAVRNLADKKRGLVIVTGATGSGKSTTLAALVDIINKKYAKHIITLEDPIEYLHRHDKSMVTQRELGLDSLSYTNALRAALRQDPDVILLGEMRDLETISTAITAAETGHLVFSTLHTNDAASTIDRIIDVFPPHQQQQIRIQLANVLKGVVAQQLLPKADGSGRVAVFEIMLGNYAISNLIREGKTFQIPGVMQTSKKDGMIVMDDAIVELFKEGKITRDAALKAAHDSSLMGRKI